MNPKIIKTFRYFRLVGIRRTILKICGRMRMDLPLFCFFFRKKPRIGVIGCGQFAFSTIGYFVYAKTRESFALCFDIDSNAAKSFSSFFHGCKMVQTADEIISDPSVEIIYIASDHYSHTPYAVSALNHGKKIHLEKPISVSDSQWILLKDAIRQHPDHIYVGYNRPFSPAVQRIDLHIKQTHSPVVLNCFIAGHRLPLDHWYRDPKEGGRICGNLGHWLDLAVHLMNVRGNIPQRLITQIAFSHNNDNLNDIFSITMSSDLGDLITILLTSQSEPLEGIHENIQLQCGSVLATIDDFRNVEIWDGVYHCKKKFSPKDVGHKKCILQALQSNKQNRDQKEYFVSTDLMLHLKRQEELHCFQSEYIVNYEP